MLAHYGIATVIPSDGKKGYFTEQNKAYLPWPERSNLVRLPGTDSLPELFPHGNGQGY